MNKLIISVLLGTTILTPIISSAESKADPWPYGPVTTSNNINGGSIGIINPAVIAIIRNPVLYGQYETAVAASIIANHAAGRPQVNGWVGPSGIATAANRDTVALYIENTGLPPVANVSGGSFTTTTYIPATPFSASVVSQFQIGMFIDTDTNQSLKYSGTITGWASDGTSVTVSGWFQQGNQTPGQIPTGTTAIINPQPKVFGQNTNVFINNTSYATSIQGYELGILDTSATASTNQDYGFDVVNLGTNTLTAGYYMTGPWNFGYVTAQSGGTGFYTTQSSGNAFSTIQTSGNAFISSPTGIGQTFAVNAATGNIELGGVTTATTNAILDMHSSGGTLDYDSRIITTGGDGVTLGAGTLTVRGGHIVLAATSGPTLAVEQSGTVGVVCIGATSDCDGNSHHIQTVASQFNAINIIGAATGGAVSISPRGQDASIILTLGAKGASTQVDFLSHIGFSSAVGVPTAPTCEGTGTVSGTDILMHVLGGGSTSTTCTVQFGNAWGATPRCLVVVEQGDAVLNHISWVESTGSIVITGATTDTAAQFNILCMGTTT